MEFAADVTPKCIITNQARQFKTGSIESTYLTLQGR